MTEVESKDLFEVKEKKKQIKKRYTIFMRFENKFDAVYSMQIILENFGNIIKDKIS